MFRSRTISKKAAGGVLIAAFAAWPAAAVEYLITPRVNQRLSYEDNLQITSSENEIYSSMYRLSPGIKASATGQAWRFTGDARVDVERFSASGFDTENAVGEATIGHFTERRQLQLSSNYRLLSQRETEAEGSGIQLTNDRVEVVDLRPVGYWQLTELYGLTVGGSYTNRHYESIDFTDYRNYGFDVTLARQLSERMLLEVTAFVSDYVTDSIKTRCTPTSLAFFQGELADLESDTLGVQIGLRRSLSDRYSWGASVGGRDVETTAVSRTCDPLGFLFGVLPDPLIVVEGEDTSNGLIANMSLGYEGQRLSYDLTLERSVSPVSLGFLIQTDRFDARVRHRLTERAALVSQLVVQQAESITTGLSYDRDYYSATFSFDWRLTQRWRLTPGLRWRRSEFLNVQQNTLTGNSWSVFVDLKFQAKSKQFSR